MHLAFCLHVCLQARREHRSHYWWLWATMWLLGIELRTFRKAGSALNQWAISPAQFLSFLSLKDIETKILVEMGSFGFLSYLTYHTEKAQSLTQRITAIRRIRSREIQRTGHNLRYYSPLCPSGASSIANLIRGGKHPTGFALFSFDFKATMIKATRSQRENKEEDSCESNKKLKLEIRAKPYEPEQGGRGNGPHL